MGKVFTAQAVGQRHVPALADFAGIRRIVSDALGTEPAIKSALVFGSVAAGTHTIRSDLDCAVVYDWEQHDRAYCLMERLCVEAAQVHVPLSFAVSDAGTASGAGHHFGPSFREHLKRAQASGGLIKGDVCAHFGRSVSIQEEAYAYLRHKLYKLVVGQVSYCSFGDERQAAYLTKMLEAPLHVARKTLVFFNELRGDLKHEVVEAYCRELADGQAREMLHKFLALDAAYTEELRARLDDKIICDYEEHTGVLFSHASEVIAFVRYNLGLLDFASDKSRP